MLLRDNLELLQEGEVYRGTVVFVAPFGVWIELIKGQMDGLLLFDETPYPEIAKSLQLGQQVDVVATTVNVPLEKVRVQLLRDATLYERFWAKKNATQ